ncbi:hypothetical protein QMK54_06440 [Pseudomonas sp. P5_109]|uniref:hypothetical protein n=1 Tax=Pseudomonas TaxID=286 RepID=UPI0015E8AFD5|nr:MULTISPECIES: hypothetical protein [Pseudomonas]WPN33308.1 hypothetical protein QMK54_06440 [Pseudomonas sp. P5_109]
MTRIKECGGISALFRFVFRLFLWLAQRHGLLERLANFIEPFVIEVMNTLGALSIEVNQFVILAHGGQCIA